MQSRWSKLEGLTGGARVPATSILNTRQAPHAWGGGGQAQKKRRCRWVGESSAAHLAPLPQQAVRATTVSSPVCLSSPAVPLKLKKEREAEWVYCSHRMW